MICSCSKLWKAITSVEKTLQDALKEKRKELVRMSHMQNLSKDDEMVAVKIA